MSKWGQPLGIGMVSSQTELGSFIRDCRMNLGLSQVQLAERAEVKQGLVSNLEIGTRKRLYDQRLDGLAKALQCDKWELQKRMPIKSNPQPRTESGRFIRSQREKLGLSMDAFAKKMDMTVLCVKDLECSKRPGIQYQMAKRLAIALGLDLSDFASFLGIRERPTRSKLGQLIRKRRKVLGMSCYMLAEKLNVSVQRVSQIELKEHRRICQDTLVKLAKALKIEISELEAARPEKRSRSKLRPKLKKVKTRSTALGGFLTNRRLELGLTQAQVAKLIGKKATCISNIETGIIQPDSQRLGKIASVLKCEIPADLVPAPNLRSPKGKQNHVVAAVLSDKELSDFIVTKKLLRTKKSCKVIRKALDVLRQLLEAEKSGHEVLVKNGDTIKTLDLRSI